MAREIEPDRPASRAPRGCLVTYAAAVLVLAAALVLLGLMLRPLAGK